MFRNFRFVRPLTPDHSAGSQHLWPGCTEKCKLQLKPVNRSFLDTPPLQFRSVLCITRVDDV